MNAKKMVRESVLLARLGGGGGYLPSLSINYVTMSKDMEKKLTQLYYIKMKISYDLGFIAIGVAMATKRRHYVFLFTFGFLCTRSFF